MREKGKNGAKRERERERMKKKKEVSLFLCLFPAYLALAFSGTKSKMLGLVTNL